MTKEWRQCAHEDCTPSYFGTYGSLLGGCSPCRNGCVEGENYCCDHRTEEKRAFSQKELEGLGALPGPSLSL